MKKVIASIMLMFAPLIGENATSIYDINVTTIEGKEITLGERYKDKVLLIVNVASECGYTNQYGGLQELHQKYHAKGLRVLGFPCNQFLGQEPKDEAQIKSFCVTTFGVKFDMFSKIEVNGDKTHPLYQYLKNQAKGTLGSVNIKWNFTKFLVDREGKVIKRYGSSTKPKALEKDIEALLR